MRGSIKSFYPWLIAASCFCIQGVGLGIVHNCRGIFFNELIADLGVQMNQLMGYMAVFGVASVLAMPLVPRCIEKWNFRLVIGGCAIFISVAQFVQGYFTALWQWYIVGLIQGACYAFMVPLTVPLLIRNWFLEKRGVVLGVVGSASGIIGAIMNAVGNYIIIENGWRAAYRVLGLVSFILVVPACCFLLRLTPEQVGLKAYGYDKHIFEEKTLQNCGVILKQAYKTLGFWLMLTVTAIICYNTCFNQLLKGFGLSLGWNAVLAGSLTTVAMIGNIVSKVLLGRICDVRGIYPALFVGLAMVSTGFICCLFGQNLIALIIGAFMAGVPSGISVVLFPVWTISQFGEKYYSSIFTVVSIVMNLFSSFGYLILSGLMGNSGDYSIVLYFCCFSCFVAAILVATVGMRSKKLRMEVIL